MKNRSFRESITITSNTNVIEHFCKDFYQNNARCSQLSYSRAYTSTFIYRLVKEKQGSSTITSTD